MHFSSGINRPPYETADGYLQTTEGCSHNTCLFCTYFKDQKFRKSSIEEIEADIREMPRYFGAPKRIFLQGADGYAADYDVLMKTAELLHKYVPSVETIGGYARIDNFYDKTEAQLRNMAAVGYAASKGQNVVLLEKSGMLGGAATVSGAGMTSGITEPVLSKFEWMRDLYVGMGVDLQPTSFPGYEQIKGAVVPSTENRYGGARLIDGLIDICRNNNVTILMDTPATGLVTEDGVVTGVTAQPRGQEPFTVTAGSVILATGGFGHNAEMIAEYMPQFKGVWMANPVGSVGDAIGWVRELGAKLVDLDSNANFHSVNPATGYRAVTGQLWLDAEGNNFSEVNDYSTSTRDAWLQMGSEKYYILSTAEYLESAKSESDLAHDLMSGSVVKYDSMEAVMEACGMPNMPETLAAHELADASGYYVSPARAALYSTYGGIGVDDVGHVLTEADEPIPHLYAVGEVIGSKDYQVNGFYVGQLGQAMTMAALAVDDITNG